MKKRLFVAIKLSQSTLNTLISFQKELKQQLPFKGIRWVDPALFHLTLQFIGDTDVNQISPLNSSLECAARNVKPFDLTFEGSGFFGSRMAVRTIWAGTKPSTELHQLFTQVIESTGFLRLEQQARFSPHLTLARVSDWVSKEENVLISKNLSLQESQTFGITQVASFELIESSLTPSGPVYKSVHIFQLR